jgi:ATP-binding cassette subfamily B protein
MLQHALAASERVFDVLDTVPDVRDEPGIQAPVARFTGAVAFDHVQFHYRSDAPILKDVGIAVRAGERVALVGPSGAGKSTTLKLLNRFYDVTGGRILIDGFDARTLHLDDLRRNIGIVFQESFLFSNTIAANIAFGHPGATREQIVKAAKIAAADEFIVRLPLGYDTVLGESGSSLSGGQRQRLAIARAVLLEPAILLLDDPTAAIDSETEQEIFDALDRAIAGRTTFIVAHRLSTLRRADFILVMEGGRIVQRGTHEELIKLPGPYLHVANLQLVDSRELAELKLREEGLS